MQQSTSNLLNELQNTLGSYVNQPITKNLYLDMRSDVLNILSKYPGGENIDVNIQLENNNIQVNYINRETKKPINSVEEFEKLMN